MAGFTYLGPPSNDSEEVLLDRLFLEHHSTLAVDTETVSLKDRTLIGIGLSPNLNEAYYFEVLPEPSPHLDAVWDLLENPDTLKVFHNALFDLGVLGEPFTPIADTSVMMQMQALPYKLKDAAHYYLATEIDEIADVLPARKTMLDLTLAVVADKCLHDAFSTHRLFEQMGGRKWLDKANGHTWTYQPNWFGGWQPLEPTSYYVSPQMKDCYDVDIRLIPLLLRMGERGLALRQDRLEAWYERLSHEKLFYQDICTQHGFSAGSNQQVGYTLAERGTVLKFTQTRGRNAYKQLKVDEDVLSQLADPLAQVVLQYRHRDKLLCLDENTPILMADLTWKPIKLVGPGDVVFGFDEEPPGRACAGSYGHRRFKEATVEAVSTRLGKAFKIVTDTGSVTATANHRWLVYPTHPDDTTVGVARQWMGTSELKPGMALSLVAEPVCPDKSYEVGYLEAAFDGEGCLSRTHTKRDDVSLPDIVFTQNDNEMLAKVGALLSTFDFRFTEYSRVAHPGANPSILLRIRGGISELIRFMCLIRPTRFPTDWWKGLSRGARAARVLYVEPAGTKKVAHLQTSTGTFIAGGFMSHNSTYIKPWLGEERAYTHFGLETGTGRLRSFGRNIQNIPVPIREIFEPDSGVWTWLDDNQIEMRVFAYLSQDPMMLEAYRLGSDIHTATQAALWPGGSLQDKELRVRVKGFNFSMIFLAQPPTLSKHSGLPLETCRRFREEWLDYYEIAADYMVRQQEAGLGQGWTMTDYGRKQRLPDPSIFTQTHIASCAINYPTQGTAADIVKRQLLECKEMDLAAQVHDEILQDGDEDWPEGLDHIHPEIETPYKVRSGPVWSAKED